MPSPSIANRSGYSTTMTLLLLGCEGEDFAAFDQQLKNLSHTVAATAEPEVAASLCESGDVRLLVQFERWEPELAAKADQCNCLSVYASYQSTPRDQLLDLMRDGCVDCWDLPLSEDALEARVQAVSDRHASAQRAVVDELASLRAEKNSLTGP